MSFFNTVYLCIRNKDAAGLKAAILEKSADDDINAYFQEDSFAITFSTRNLEQSDESAPVSEMVRYNPLHLAVTQKWLDGVMILKLAGASVDIPAVVNFSTFCTYLERCNFSAVDLARLLELPKIQAWLTSPDNPVAWFHEDWIQKILKDFDTSTDRALFQIETFQSQESVAREKYEQSFSVQEWFDADYLEKFWISTEHIPETNRIKTEWKRAHADLRARLFEHHVAPYILLQNSIEQKLSLFSEWKSYINYLYTPASGIGNDSYTSFSSYWYNPEHENCPAWLKASWVKEEQKNIGNDEIMIIEEVPSNPKELHPLLSKLDALDEAFASQKEKFLVAQVQKDKNTPSDIIRAVCIKKNLVPFSQIAALILPNSESDSPARNEFAPFVITHLKTIFRMKMADIKMLSIHPAAKKNPLIIQLTEALKILSQEETTSDSLFLNNRLMLELGPFVNAAYEASVKKKGIIKIKKSSRLIKEKHIEKELGLWLDEKIRDALSHSANNGFENTVRISPMIRFTAFSKDEFEQARASNIESDKIDKKKLSNNKNKK